jgi:hypothetical protein
MAAAETWGNLMSIIKAYNTLENLLVILYQKNKHLTYFKLYCPSWISPFRRTKYGLYSSSLFILTQINFLVFGYKCVLTYTEGLCDLVTADSLYWRYGLNPARDMDVGPRFFLCRLLIAAYKSCFR